MGAKNPIRTCVGCRRSGAKDDFIRVVKSPDGTVALDSTGKAPGRGAYLCFSEVCLKKAVKASRLARALRASVDETVMREVEDLVACGSAAGQS